MSKQNTRRHREFVGYDDYGNPMYEYRNEVPNGGSGAQGQGYDAVTPPPAAGTSRNAYGGGYAQGNPYAGQNQYAQGPYGNNYQGGYPAYGSGSQGYTQPPEETPKKKNRNTFGKILLAIQLILSGVVVVLVAFLNLLPSRYLMAGICFLAVLWLIGVLLQVPRGSRVFGKVCTIFVIIVLALGTVYLWKTNAALSNIFGQKLSSKADFSVVVMADSPYESVEDLNGATVGVQERLDADSTQKALAELQKTADVYTDSFNSYVEAAEALYNGQVDAILLNETHREMLLDTFPEFSRETRVLSTTTVHQEVKQQAESSVSNVDVASEPFTIYISGNDAYGQISYDGGRSDVNILLTVNPNTKQIVMTSTPRDFYIYLPEDEFGYGARDKLTHAGIYGVNVSEEILEDLYDVDIDYYFRINFGGFEDVVNALGGVEVYSDYSFTDVSGQYYFSEGYNYVDGSAALAFVRERYAFSDGDMQRGRNQMAMIKAIINKVTSPAILTSYMDLMDSLSGCFITDMPQSKLGDLVKMQLNDNTDWNIVQNNVIGAGDMQYTYSGGMASVLWPDEDSVEAAKQRIRDCENGVIFGD